jgi:PKD repeat protein
MKKFVWLYVLAMLLSLTSFTQNYSIVVSGNVFDQSTPVPLPVENQAVYIAIDSTGTSFFYQDTVFTDSTGLFISEISIPPEVVIGFVTVSTFDSCLNTYQVQVAPFGQGIQLPPFNFLLCDNNPPECMALFYWDYQPDDPLTLQFFDMSVGNYTEVLWDFGDGNTSTEADPVHTYAEGGLYEVCLTISDSSGFCINTGCDFVQMGFPYNGCENYFTYFFTDTLSAEFSGYLIDSSYNALNYLWDFGDGTTDTGQVVTHTFTPTGTDVFLVCLTTTGIDETGDTCTSISCQPVILGYPPPPSPCESYFIPINTSGLTVDFEAFTLSQFPTEFYWDFGDNSTDTGQMVTHTYLQAGIYPVTLTSIDSTGCEFVFMIDVLVGEIPPGCDNFFFYDQNDTLTFTFTGQVFWGDSSNAYQTEYYWDFGDGTTDTGQVVTHTFQDNPAYQSYVVCLSTYSYSQDGDSCFATSCQDVYVGGGGWDCFNWFDYWPDELTVDFTGYVWDGLPADYDWDFGDGYTGTGQQITHTYDTAGIYVVTLTTADSSGCTYTSSMDVWVDTYPVFSVYGSVILDSNLFADDATVRLMTTDSLWQNVVEVGSTTINDSGLYMFDSIPWNNFQLYFVQAELNSGSAWFGQYLPTYHISSLTWQEAMPVLPIPNWSTDIYMIPGTPVNSGDGMIYGNVTNLGTREVVEGVEVMLMNDSMEPHTYVRSDENGEFSFEELAYGTYMIRAEMMGMNTTPAMIILHEDQPEVSVEIQVESSEVNYVFSVSEQLSILSGVSKAYPNPARKNAMIEFSSEAPSTLILILFNQVGQITWRDAVDLSFGINQVTIPLEGLPSGFYYLRATTQEGDFISRRVIKSN